MKTINSLLSKWGILVFILLLVVSEGCIQQSTPSVVVYTSIDQPYAEPILNAFQEKTGIRVLAVYDTEATKTTGLVSRLMAEKDKPQADVFWSSEIAQTLWLKDQNILSSYNSPESKTIPEEFRDTEGYWTGVGLRARIILINTDLVPTSEYPESIFDLLDSKWKPGEIGIANPLFGTTATHAAALYVSLGDNEAQNYFETLKNNGARILDGNSVVRDMVASGDIKVGLTDTDDAYGAIAQGKPVKIIFPDQDGMGTLFIPTTVALIGGSPNSDEGEMLIDFLLSNEVEKMLLDSGFLYSSTRLEDNSQESLIPMKVNWNDIALKMDFVKNDLRDIFLR